MLHTHYEKYAIQRQTVLCAVETLKECIEFLNKNAIIPANTSIPQIFDQLILSERTDHKKGYEKRIEVLENLKQNKPAFLSKSIDENEILKEARTKKATQVVEKVYVWVKNLFK